MSDLDEKRWILLESVGKLVRMDVYLLTFAGKLVKWMILPEYCQILDGSWSILVTSYPFLIFEVFSL